MSKRTVNKSDSQKAPLENDGVAVNLMPEQEALVADFQRLEEDLQRLSNERESLHNQLLRTIADMQNYKSRVEQERQALRVRATEDLLRDLLPILDSFERTARAAEAGASAESIAEGVRGVEKLLRSKLESRSLKQVPAMGAHFDPAIHDAIAVVADSEEPAGTIVEVLENGYTLGGQVIRPARVKVAKGLS